MEIESLVNPVASLTISPPNSYLWNGLKFANPFWLDPCYFRNINYDDLVLLDKKPKHIYANNDFILTTKESLLSEQGKAEPNYKEVKIMGPPCGVKLANLHGFGNYPDVPGQSIENAQFSVVVYEGDTPNFDLTHAVRAEQQDFFDFCEKVSSFVLEKMWENPAIRKQEKENFRKDALQFASFSIQISPEDSVNARIQQCGRERKE